MASPSTYFLFDLRNAARKALPWIRRLVFRADSFIRTQIITGGAAGNFTCNMQEGDKLISVMFLNYTGPVLSDLTSQFTPAPNGDALRGIPAGVLGNGAVADGSGVINNTGGTASTGGVLLLMYESYNASQNSKF